MAERLPDGYFERLDRLRKACRRGERTHDHQVALVMRMLTNPRSVRVEQARGRRRRYHVPGSLDSPRRTL